MRLDLVDFGIVLLNRDLRARFMNRRFGELWNLKSEFLATGPTRRELVDNAAAHGWYAMPQADLPAYLDAREAEVRDGSIPPTLIELADRRHMLFRCVACADGGRILTYADISREMQGEASDAVARVSAEQRFNSEMLEEQGAHLATLAEAAEDNAQKAEASRLLLEHENYRALPIGTKVASSGDDRWSHRGLEPCRVTGCRSARDRNRPKGRAETCRADDRCGLLQGDQ